MKLIRGNFSKIARDGPGQTAVNAKRKALVGAWLSPVFLGNGRSAIPRSLGPNGEKLGNSRGAVSAGAASGSPFSFPPAATPLPIPVLTVASLGVQALPGAGVSTGSGAEPPAGSQTPPRRGFEAAPALHPPDRRGAQ